MGKVDYLETDVSRITCTFIYFDQYVRVNCSDIQIAQFGGCLLAPYMRKSLQHISLQTGSYS